MSSSQLHPLRYTILSRDKHGTVSRAASLILSDKDTPVVTGYLTSADRRDNNNNNNIHISIPPLVVTSEAVAAQVASLFDMDQIKTVSLKPGFEDCY